MTTIYRIPTEKERRENESMAFFIKQKCASFHLESHPGQNQERSVIEFLSVAYAERFLIAMFIECDILQ